MQSSGVLCQMEELFACPEQLKHSAMLMIDADNLKQVNDNYGHEDGDRYLCSVADVLRTVTAEHQIITRLGGRRVCYVPVWL